MLMAGYNAPGIRYKIKCPYCDEIKESGGIKTHVLYKHKNYYEKEKYTALLDGNFYKQDLIIFPPKEAKAIPKGTAKEVGPEQPVNQQGKIASKPVELQEASQASVPKQPNKPKHLEITEVREMPGKPEAQPIQKDDEFGCQKCGETWNGFKPRCPKCGAELDYNNE